MRWTGGGPGVTARHCPRTHEFAVLMEQENRTRANVTALAQTLDEMLHIRCVTVLFDANRLVEQPVLSDR
ncbi:hypothetical protein MES5069_270060 [Mesorhizobium escarrei]|uniref:Uncharacterized protein n=1 Tax=Mesorhizobium escarrei TaxID=666018 RepID=A0ABM9DVT3_9HYPH|nr:hypothetical protein MES5069_270060 [Mesorhizobium escarrei]